MRTIAKYTPDNKGWSCHPDDCADEEHLHASCPCGYKYVMNTADQAEPDEGTDFRDVIGPQETSSGTSSALYR